MKQIKLSFPYPSTSRHNLSQDIGTSMSMGLVIPIRTVKVLPGDSHRIGTSFSLLSNPLVKPLLQGVRMRYMRFWVPSRIYHIDRRANNANYDPRTADVRYGWLAPIFLPYGGSNSSKSSFQASSLFDYLQIANIESNLISPVPINRPDDVYTVDGDSSNYKYFNAEPYLGYIDICRNNFADSATNLVAWSCDVSVSGSDDVSSRRGVCISPLTQLDSYIDSVQNSRGVVTPYNYTNANLTVDPNNTFTPFCLPVNGQFNLTTPKFTSLDARSFSTLTFGRSHVGFCVPMNRPDRFSRLFDLKPLTSQNATISPSEISISNLSFLSKLQRYLTRTFFGGTRYTDLMYSVFGQKVPHVDSPVLLDVFDKEIGTELVQSTNATDTQNPGVLGGYFASSGYLTSGRGSYKKRYTFNEEGYLMDLVYIMPRLFRAAFYPDFYPVTGSGVYEAGVQRQMQQGNFIPDFNGIGWQQPAFVSSFRRVTVPETGSASIGVAFPFACEPSWQQYRTLPDVVTGLMNPLRTTDFDSVPGELSRTTTINSPLFTFNDRMTLPFNSFTGLPLTDASKISEISRQLLAFYAFTDFNNLNAVFGSDILSYDNIFVVFRYAHQVKSQVTKRFTLSFA